MKEGREMPPDPPFGWNACTCRDESTVAGKLDGILEELRGLRRDLAAGRGFKAGDKITLTVDGGDEQWSAFARALDGRTLGG